MKTITDRIKHILDSERYSVGSFARKLGIPWTSANNIVSGRNMPSYDNIVKIIENFGWVDANWLVMGQKGEADLDKKKLYSVIAAQQKIIESQQKTIDRLTSKLVHDLPDDSPQKVVNVG